MGVRSRRRWVGSRLMVCLFCPAMAWLYVRNVFVLAASSKAGQADLIGVCGGRSFPQLLLYEGRVRTWYL